MLRNAWKPIIGTVAVGTPLYLCYRYWREQTTFSLPIKQKGSTETTNKYFSLLSLKDIDERIRANAISETRVRPNGLSWKYTTASLSSNDPIEDAHASQIIQRDDDDPLAPGDYLFFAVMDGHSGYHTSQLLSRVLINAVALELSQLIQKPESTSHPGRLELAKSFIWSPNPSPSAMPAHQRVSLAIQDAFTKLDAELLNAPLRILATSVDEESQKTKAIPDLSQHPLALPTMSPATSGSCAIMAVFDTANRDLYVACTGDSRAVAGVWEPTEDGKGRWRVEALSEDQTGRNLDEKKRMQSEHPAEEADYVIRNGRVLGGLEPTRAFGDARYKWSRPIQEVLNQAFMIGNNKAMTPPSPLLRTPPYVTATPVVTHRKLSFSSENESAPQDSIRFVVLATDGLWDQLTNEEVVALVGGHFAGLNGKVSRSDLPNLIPTSAGSQGVEGKKKKDMKTEGHWAFQDENISTHLIRNAFGGGDEVQLKRLLSIPAPYSRRYRDDVTVTVIWWAQDGEDGAKVASITESAKAKL
jgi:pyruvate dehydrogenase phosphatase